MNTLRGTVLAISDNPGVTKFFRSSRLVRGMVSRFVAGETVQTALDATRDLAANGITATLDQLGENVGSCEEAERAVDSYGDTLRHLHRSGLEPNISVKLTMVGLEFGSEVARRNMASILTVAREVSGFVRIDMEGSRYTEDTMTIAEELHQAFPLEVGTVIQSYMRRAEEDVRRCNKIGMRVRLVKGAYAEPEDIAFQKRVEVDENYARLTRMLLSDGNYPAIGTHDMALIRSAIEHAQRHQIAAERYEFQMLYGVRRDQQNRLVDDGYRMRVYVPFGTEWYPYFTRRIAERPANALFVLRQLSG